MPSRAFPVTAMAMWVRTTAVRLVNVFTIWPIEQGLTSQSEHWEKHSSKQGCVSDATDRERRLRPAQPDL